MRTVLRFKQTRAGLELVVGEKVVVCVTVFLVALLIWLGFGDNEIAARIIDKVMK